MIWFLFLFFAIYGSMHAYAFWKLHAAFPRLGRWRWALAGLLVLLVLCPVLVRVLERRLGWHWVSVVGVYNYTWFVTVFWLFCLGLVLDLWNVLAWVTARAVPKAKTLALSPRARLAFCGVAIVAAYCWGYFVEAPNIRVRRVTLPASGLERPVRLVQISDLHLGETAKLARLQRITRLVAAAEPDVIVSTGDLVDGAAHHLNGFSELLEELEAPLGKFAVLGNHESYAGVDHCLQFHRAAGFQVLRSEMVEVAPGLHVAGVDDPAGEQRGHTVQTSEDFLPLAGDPSFTILLKHRPYIAKESIGRFDLQLSGHTHGGQIFPFALITAGRYDYNRGLYEPPNGSIIYVSPGAGTWGPPVRVSSPPEITVFDLTPADPTR